MNEALWHIEPTAFDALRSRLPMQIDAQTAAALMQPTTPQAAAYDVQPGSVAVIQVSGPLVRRPRAYERLYYGFSSTVDIADGIRAAAADTGVSSILLAVDSPGGSSNAWGVVADAIADARKRKPVHAHTETLMASAAYAIASQVDSIGAGASALVGSIGTLIVLYDFSKLLADVGVKAHVIATGPLKGTGVFGTELTAEQQAGLQEVVDDTQQLFRQAVLRGRAWDKLAEAGQEKLRQVTSGNVFVAARAKGLGLIDRVATFEAFMQEISGAAGAPAGGGRPRNQGAPMSATETSAAAPETIRLDAVQAERKRCKDLREAFPDDAAFALKAIDAGWDVTTAKAEYATVLSAQLKSEREKNAKLEADAKTVKTTSAIKTVTTEPLGQNSGGAGGAAGSVKDEVDGLVADAMERFKEPRHKAFARVMSNNPDLAERLDREANEKKK